MAESGSWTFVSEDFDPMASPPLDVGEMEKLGGTARVRGRERLLYLRGVQSGPFEALIRNRAAITLHARTASSDLIVHIRVQRYGATRCSPCWGSGAAV